MTKYFLHHEMDRGAKESGVERIRIHDLRHSHISLLIELGFSAVAIGDRVGHESVVITYRYAHMFPSTQDAMAEGLSKVRNEGMEKKTGIPHVDDSRVDAVVKNIRRETRRGSGQDN